MNAGTDLMGDLEGGRVMTGGTERLPVADGTLRFMLLGLRKNTRRRCDDCANHIRDRRPGPFKQNTAVCIDRVLPSGDRRNWVALLCKGCAVKRYHWPQRTLAEIYWPETWDDATNVA